MPVGEIELVSRKHDVIALIKHDVIALIEVKERDTGRRDRLRDPGLLLDRPSGCRQAFMP